jgi:hypothetical protein
MTMTTKEVTGAWTVVTAADGNYDIQNPSGGYPMFVATAATTPATLTQGMSLAGGSGPYPVLVSSENLYARFPGGQTNDVKIISRS